MFTELMKFKVIKGQVENLRIEKGYVQYGYTLATNFSIKSLEITLPNQTKTANLLKDGDNIIISCRKSLFKKNNRIGFAYKYSSKNHIYAINEKWNYINASLALITSFLGWFFLPEQRVIMIFAFAGSAYYYFEAYQATIAKKLLCGSNVKL